MRWVRDYNPRPEQSRLYIRALVITLGGNLLLAVMKGVTAAVSGSVALYADAANSVSDVVYSLMMVFGLWISQRPPDLSHPQGHGRYEPLVGLVVTGSMAYAGFEAARAGIERFAMGGEAVTVGLPTIVLLGSAAIKAGMYIWIRQIAVQVSSATLATTAQDNLSDVLTSAAALVGTLGSTFVHPLMDPLAGLLVSAWIFRNVLRAARENLGFITGAGADEALRKEIVRVAESVPGVIKVHHMMSEYSGSQFVVDMHLNVKGSISLEEAHAISDEVIARVEGIRQVDRAYVHMEPEGYD